MRKPPTEPYLEPEQLSPTDRWCKRFLYVGVPALIILFALLGCTTLPHWQKVRGEYRLGSIVRYETPEALYRICGWPKPGSTRMGCTGFHWYNGEMVATIYLHPAADDCDLHHEHAHRKGWIHDERDVYVKDCGPE